MVCLAGGVVGISAIALAQVVAIWRQDQWIITLLSAHDPGIGVLANSDFRFIGNSRSARRRGYDEIRMELFNGLLKFEGASGPIILWMICFLSIVVSVKLLW